MKSNTWSSIRESGALRRCSSEHRRASRFPAGGLADYYRDLRQQSPLSPLGDAMIKFGSAIIAFGTAAMLLVSQSEAQQKRTSPRDQIYTRVGGKLVSISYGRPYSKSPKKGEIR